MAAEVKIEDGYNIAEYDEYGNRIRYYGTNNVSDNIRQISISGNRVAALVASGGGQPRIQIFHDGIPAVSFWIYPPSIEIDVENIQMSSNIIIVQFTNGLIHEYNEGGAVMNSYNR